MLHACDKGAESFLRAKPTWRSLDSLCTWRSKQQPSPRVELYRVGSPQPCCATACHIVWEVVAAAEVVAEAVVVEEEVAAHRPR